jgi:hypothetical protein
MAGESQTYTLFRPDIWSPRTTEYFFANLKAGKFFEDFSDLVVDGGKTVIIPTISNFSVTAVNQNSGEVNATSMTDTVIRLDINRWMAVPKRLSEMNFAQMARSFRLRDEMAQSQAKSLSEFFDKELLDACAGITQQASVGNAVKVISNSTTALGATGLEDAIRLMHSNNYPLDECAFFINPAPYWSNIAKVSKYYDASQYGGQTVTKGGANTSLYGIPVYITSNVDKNSAGYRNLLVHKSTVGYAIGALPGGGNGVALTEKDSEYLRKTIYAKILYGVKLRRTLGGVRIYSRGT